MLTIARYIRHLPKDASCHTFCTGATHAIAALYRKSMLGHLAQHPEDRLTASCIVFSRLRREIWMVGDCQGMALRDKATATDDSNDAAAPDYFDNPKPYEEELAQKRAAIITASPQPWDHFLDDDTARKAIIPRMLECMQQQNKTYSVVDGFPIPGQHVRTITLDFQPWQVVLASDGYPFLCPTLAESEQRLAGQRSNDPLNIGRFKATKAFCRGNNSFDDRAYIRFSV